MDDATLLEVLHATATAIADALGDLDDWGLAGTKVDQYRHDLAADAAALAVLDEAGFVGTLATNTEFEILRYLHLGDVVSARSTIESISEEKQTRLGPGRFVTWVTSYTDADGLEVGRQRFRILKFKPGGDPS